MTTPQEKRDGIEDAENSIMQEVERQAKIRGWKAPNLNYVVREALKNQRELLHTVAENPRRECKPIFDRASTSSVEKAHSKGYAEGYKQGRFDESMNEEKVGDYLTKYPEATLADYYADVFLSPTTPSAVEEETDV